MSSNITAGRAGTVCCSSVDAFFQVRKTDQAGWTRETLQSRVSRKRRGMLAQRSYSAVCFKKSVSSVQQEDDDSLSDNAFLDAVSH